MEKYDLAVLGAGPGGYVAAIRGAQLGAKVCVIEKEEVGGTCLNWGCIPTKALIASSRALEKVKSGKEYGFEIEGNVVSHFERIMARKGEVVKRQVKGIQALFKGYGVALYYGTGRLLDQHVIDISNRDSTKSTIYADKIIIATGSKPSDIPGIAIDGKAVLSSNEALTLKEIPKNILIIGAGAIGCEFASIFHALGSEVIIVELLARAVPMEDQEISQTVERELKKKRIELYVNASVKSIDQGADGKVKVHLSDGTELEVEKVLVSVGRIFNVQNIGLEALGIAQGKRGEIKVNEKMETNRPGIYAIGDVVGGMMLAHVASREGIVAVENALGGHEIMDYSAVPSCIFFNPEIASVGLRERDAIAKKHGVKIGRFYMRGIGMAHALGELSGFIKVISDSDTDRILGVHMIGAHVTELIHEAVLAVQSSLTARHWAKTIHAHPTMSEALHEAIHDLHDSAIHLPPKEKL